MNSLLTEAERRARELALAKSIVQDHEGWFAQNTLALLHETGKDELELSGNWIGPRRGFKEVARPELITLALRDMLGEFGMPVEEMFKEYGDADRTLQMVDKNLRKNPDWREPYLTRLDYHGGEDGVMTVEKGKVNYSPIKKRPSEEHYEILTLAELPNE